MHAGETKETRDETPEFRPELVEVPEGLERELTTCPNCGNEIREDFTFCPFCETPLKPFCPSCKRELEPGYVRCPYCGFRLGSETPAKKLYVKGGKSRFLVSSSS